MLTSSPLALERHTEDDCALDESGMSLDERCANGEEVERDELEGTSEALEDPETEGNVEPDLKGRDVWSGERRR